MERLFSEFLILVDPVTNLGLAAESVKSYLIGDLERSDKCFIKFLNIKFESMLITKQFQNLKLALLFTTTGKQ